MKHIKSYNFWIRLVSVVVLLLRVVGAELGFSIDTNLIIDVATIIASVLVVLGVIQVPTEKVDDSNENENNIGGEFMMSFEKIKQDIITAKEKLVQNFEENEILKEVTQLLDNILGSNITGSIEQDFYENRVNPDEVVISVDESNLSTQTDENGGNSTTSDDFVDKTIISDENQTVYNDKEITHSGDTQITSEVEIQGDEVGGETSNTDACDEELVSVQEVLINNEQASDMPEAVLSESQEKELKNAIKDKIRAILESEMDEIITQIFQ